MPDTNPIEAKVPYERPEIPDAGLSLIVQPRYDYINTFPQEAKVDNNGNNPGGFDFGSDYLKEVNQRRRLLGQVPIAPGGEASYNEAKRFNDPDLGFIAGRNNEDIYAKDQGVIGDILKGIGRLGLLTATKTGTGLGYLAGLVGIDNKSEKYGSDFNSWLAGAGDNGVAKWFESIENDKIKNDWLPIYKKATEKDHGFFRHMGDLDFWTDDVTDGAAFIASAFIPGIAISKLNLGEKAMASLSKLRGLTAASELEALSAEGVEGTVQSQNLEREGLGAQIEKPNATPTLAKSTNSTLEIPKVLSWIDNAKAARAINTGSVSVINTAAQAMMSANDAKNNSYETLINQKDEQGNNKYTTDQALKISAKVAKDSYLMNLGALGVMNLWEANLIFKDASLARRNIGHNKFDVNGLFGDANLAKKTLGQRAYSLINEPVKGFVTGGVWLGNMQLAIDKLNNNSDNFDLDFGTKLKDLSAQYTKQLKDAFSGNDPDASKALGLGGLLGSVAGKLLGHDNQGETVRNLNALNGQINAFRDMGNIYKSNLDGSLDLQNGSPILDDNKVNSWVASLNKVLSLQQVAKNFGQRGVEPLAKIYQDEVFSKFAKAHFDAGLSDLLYQKLTDLKNISKADLALLGYEPDSKNNTSEQLISNYLKKGKQLEDIYDNIQNNFVPRDLNMNTKAGREKYFNMTDKMFYLSARSESIAERLRESRETYNKVHGNTEAYDESFNHETDGFVTKYNELFEQVQAAKRSQGIVQTQQDYLDRLQRREDYDTKGVSVRNAPSRLEKINRENPNVAIQLPQSPVDFASASIEKSQKALDQYVNDNKEVAARLKKDANGRIMYEIANKNLLPSSKEMEQQQIVQAELGLAHNATISVLNRLVDPRYGEKYYDQVYSKEMERQTDNYDDLLSQPEETSEKETQSDIYNLPKKDNRTFKTDVSEDDIHTALQEGKEGKEKIKNKTELSEHLAEKVANGDELTEEEDQLRDVLNEEITDKVEERNSKANIDDIFSELRDLRRQRDRLEGQELNEDDELQLEELNRKIKALEDQRDDKFDHFDNESKVDNSKNIKPEDKDKVLSILNKIAAFRKRVVKFDDHYEVDGKRYSKVTDLIGDRISDEQRSTPATQAAVSAGYTIDRIAKAYFANDLTTEFKGSLGTRISQDAYDGVIKSLDKIKFDLANKGIEIVGSNVLMVDDDLRVAGEIDLLGMDKDGNFKVYEVQARRPDVYRQYGKRGIGVTIRDIDSKRLSMYRNMFANQYGALPDEISIKFPFEVKYDRTNPSGFIEDSKVKTPIRFTPVKNVEIKLKNSEPIRIGSKFNSIDMTRIFLDTFLSDKNDVAKLQYIFRNVPFKQILSGVKLRVRPSEDRFRERYDLQKKVLNKDEAVNYKINKFRDYKRKDEFGNPREFDNLYSLVGDTEVSLSYEGQPIGYLSPVQTLAYKDADGNYQILDENTDPQTYANVTGNDPSTFGEFKRIASSYKRLYTDLTNRMIQNGGKEVTLDAVSLKDIADLKISYGELDLIKGKQNRPDLKDLKFSGIKVGNKSVPVVVNLDENDNIKVLMEKSRKGKNTFNQYQKIDKWANANLDRIVDAMTDKSSGTRLTDNVAIIETPDGEYKIISLRQKEGVDLSKENDFVENLGSKVTTSTSKDVFKNEGIMIVPKESEEKINIGLKENSILSQVYKGEDISTIEKSAAPIEKTQISSAAQQVEDFLRDAERNPTLKQDLNDLRLNDKEAILGDFEAGDWSSMEDYLSNLKNC